MFGRKKEAPPKKEGGGKALMAQVISFDTVEKLYTGRVALGLNHW